MKPRNYYDRDGVSGGVGGAAFVMRSVLLSVVVLLLMSGTMIATGSALSHGYPVTPGTKRSLNQGWQFRLEDVAGAGLAPFDDASWERVDIPHTWNLTSLALDDCQDGRTQPTFHFDITDLVRAGDNVVAILTDNTRREDVPPDDSFSTSS